jgi:hypothetical protein
LFRWDLNFVESELEKEQPTTGHELVMDESEVQSKMKLETKTVSNCPRTIEIQMNEKKARSMEKNETTGVNSKQKANSDEHRHTSNSY